MRKSALAAVFAAGFVLGNPLPGSAQDVLTTHGLSAVLAAEAVSEAVTACAKQGYKVTAAIVDSDGVTQALLRGDGASMVTLGAAPDKAYTVLMLGNEDTSGAIAQRIGASPSAGGLAKLPRPAVAVIPALARRLSLLPNTQRTTPCVEVAGSARMV